MSCTYEEGKLRSSIFYRGRVCVVTGEDSAGVDFHHLDHGGDATTSAPKNHSELNLVPIRSDIHASHHRRLQAPDLPVAWSVRSIEEGAWRTFDEGLYERAYGALRFCAFASATVGDHDTTVRASVGCLACLRALLAVDYARDTLVRSIIPAIPLVSRRAKSMLAMEIGLWLRDAGGGEMGQDYLRLAEALSKKVQDKISDDRLRLHRLEIALAVDSVLLRRDDAREQLERILQETPREVATTYGNMNLWRAAERRIRGDLEAFEEIVYSSVCRVLPSYSPDDAPHPGTRLRGTAYWPFIHTIMDAADCEETRGNLEAREAFARLAYQRLHSMRIVPVATLSRASLDWYQERHNIAPAQRIRVRSMSELGPFVALLGEVWPHLTSGLKKRR